MFVVGMFVRRVSQTAVVIAACAGLAVAVGCAWWVELNWVLGLPGYETIDDGHKNLPGPSPFLITPIAATATFLIAALLSLAFPQKNVVQAEKLSWHGVVLGKEDE